MEHQLTSVLQLISAFLLEIVLEVLTFEQLKLRCRGLGVGDDGQRIVAEGVYWGTPGYKVRLGCLMALSAGQVLQRFRIAQVSVVNVEGRSHVLRRGLAVSLPRVGVRRTCLLHLSSDLARS